MNRPRSSAGLEHLTSNENVVGSSPTEVTTCKNCDKIVSKLHIYCDNACQHEYRRNRIVQEWKDDPSVALNAALQIRSPIRKYLLDKYDHKCARCGWCECNPITGRPSLEIEHIDGDFYNNSEENLIVLCPNCHSLTPTWKALNKHTSTTKRRIAVEKLRDDRRRKSRN